MELNEKQLQILQIAEKLFAEHGFDGTSVRQIAKEADINIAMISYYFGSKEKLLEAMLIHKIADFKVEIHEVLSQKKDYIQTLEDIVSLIIRRIHKSRRIHKIINFEFSNNARQIDFESYVQFKKENYAVIEKFVKDGQEAGVFSKKVNLPLLTPTILGSYFHFYYNKRFYMSILDLKTEADIEDYVFTQLTQHVQQTIKALLIYEK